MGVPSSVKDASATQPPTMAPARPSISGGIRNLGRDFKPEDCATFVMIGKGKNKSNHAIQLKVTEEESRQEPGMDAPRKVPIRGSGIVIRFSEGAFFTPDQWIIDKMLDPHTGLGRDYDINRHDPTGYWQKNAQKYGLQIQKATIVEVSGTLIAQGPMTAGNVRAA